MLKTMKEMLLEAGYPKEEMYHHCSDLYVFANDLTTKVVEEYCEEHGLDRKWCCPAFFDQVTGKQMYDCKFQ